VLVLAGTALVGNYAVPAYAISFQPLRRHIRWNPMGTAFCRFQIAIQRQVFRSIIDWKIGPYGPRPAVLAAAQIIRFAAKPARNHEYLLVAAIAK